jgi:hypothetical protein
MAAAKKEKKPIMSCASSGHINKLKQSIFAPPISMVITVKVFMKYISETLLEMAVLHVRLQF